MFGSVATDTFDPERSVVNYLPEVHNLLGHYLAILSGLERIVGHSVDLVMSDAIENPYVVAGLATQPATSMQPWSAGIP